MRAKFWRFFSAIMFLSLVTTVNADADEWHIGAAYSPSHERGVRLGYRLTDLGWQLPSGLQQWFGDPEIGLEGALNVWQNSDRHSDNITALTLSPMFRWQLTESATPIYLEAGIGGSYLDQTSIGDRDLSTHFQFEDRVGVSWQFDPDSKQLLSLYFSHYSNADIEAPNDGVNFFSLYWVMPL